MVCTFPQLRFLAPHPLLAGDLGEAGEACAGDNCVGGERWGCAGRGGWDCDAGLFGGIGHVTEAGAIGHVSLANDGSAWGIRNIELNRSKC